MIALSGRDGITEAAARDREMQVSGFPPAPDIFGDELTDSTYKNLTDRLTSQYREEGDSGKLITTSAEPVKRYTGTQDVSAELHLVFPQSSPITGFQLHVYSS